MPIFMTENGLQQLNWVELSWIAFTPSHAVAFASFLDEAQAKWVFFQLFMHAVPKELTLKMMLKIFKTFVCLYEYIFLVMVNNAEVTI